MRTVQDHIEAQSRKLGAHRFFEDLRPRPSLKRALAFAPALIPWVMGFQDVIRINAMLARDPFVKRQVDRHAAEDQGHEVWFLEDLRLLFGDGVRDVSWLFGKETAVTREATLAIASEVFRVRDDRLRLVFIQIVEAGFSTFVARVHSHVRESGDARSLKYFGCTHEEAEAGHSRPEDNGDQDLDSIVLPEDVRSDAIAMVDRIFAEFLRIAEVARLADANAG